MPLKTLASFTVNYLQILNELGKADEQLMPRIAESDIKKMFELMLLTRAFDETALKLQREGRLGVYAPARGQEAAQVGAAFAMLEEDWLFPTYRDIGAYLTRKMPPELLYLYFKGDERGMQIPEGQNNFSLAIPVGSQIYHAVGAGIAAKIKEKKHAVLVFFGDGATSKADFHEALNFAGVFKAPVVFVCENNQWAISVPRSKQTAAQSIAQKAIAYGFSGVQVDGNDVFGVYKAVSEALEKARAGGGPTLIECVTYRMGDHTTADDASKYRDPKEVEYWKQRDPIDRLHKYMQSKGFWSAEYEEKLVQEITKRIEEAVTKAENVTPAGPTDIFKYVYAEPTQNMKEQLEELEKNLKK